MWRLQWFEHALTGGAKHLFDGNIFYPHARTLAYSDATLIQGVLAAPWLWRGANPVLVYNILLRGVPLPQGVTVPWSNEVLHVVIPLFLLADLLFAPRRRALRWSAVAITTIFPIVWVVYTMIRANLVIAPATGNTWWYPYPFLDPHLVPGGYLGVAGYIVGIAIAIIGVACFVVWVGRRRGGSPVTPEA